MSKMQNPITLFSYVTSPYAAKVHCYLLYKKLPFDIVYVNPFRLDRELPTGTQIPVLKIGLESMQESAQIGFWLDHCFPDAASILPGDKLLAQKVINMDQWVSESLIPAVFYSIYPQFKRPCLQTLSNALRLGYCVDRTTPGGLPWRTRFLWPLFLNRAEFIRQMTSPLRHSCSVGECRKDVFSFLSETLKNRQYLVDTDTPSMADLSAWPQIMMPYQLGLKGMEDFKSYPRVMEWLKEVASYLDATEKQPLLIPNALNKHPKCHIE
ncbi:MAG: glutathione S-transferase family protein [Halopseudomonas aestusnigri]